MKFKLIQIVLIVVALGGVCIFTPMVSAETAEEWNEKGNSFVTSGEYEKAIDCFDKAIELDPNYALAYRNRGNAYKDLGRYERAIEDYDKAIELDPDDDDAYDNREIARSKLEEQQAQAPIPTATSSEETRIYEHPPPYEETTDVYPILIISAVTIVLIFSIAISVRLKHRMDRQKIVEYEEKMGEWEKKGYDVSELKDALEEGKNEKR